MTQSHDGYHGTEAIALSMCCRTISLNNQDPAPSRFRPISKPQLYQTKQVSAANYQLIKDCVTSTLSVEAVSSGKQCSLPMLLLGISMTSFAAFRSCFGLPSLQDQDRGVPTPAHRFPSIFFSSNSFCCWSITAMVESRQFSGHCCCYHCDARKRLSCPCLN